jgi:hypothetical protein
MYRIVNTYSIMKYYLEKHKNVHENFENALNFFCKEFTLKVITAYYDAEHKLTLFLFIDLLDHRSTALPY